MWQAGWNYVANFPCRFIFAISCFRVMGLVQGCVDVTRIYPEIQQEDPKLCRHCSKIMDVLIQPCFLSHSVFFPTAKENQTLLQ